MYGRCTFATRIVQPFGKPIGSPTLYGIGFGDQFGSPGVVGRTRLDGVEVVVDAGSGRP